MQIADGRGGGGALEAAVLRVLPICEQILRLVERGCEFLFELTRPRYVTPDGRDARVFARDLTWSGQATPDRLIGRRGSVAAAYDCRFVFQVRGHCIELQNGVCFIIREINI